MNISQIRAFQAVMTSASLSDAARKLGRTQPAVSAAIKTLEDQLGLQLFLRDGRKLVPVPEAQYLLTEAEAILGQLSRVQQTMRSLSDGSAGALNIAAMPGPVSMLFPRFVAEQIAGNRDITVSMMARSSAQILELARAQSIDFGFADAPQDTETQTLYTADVIHGDCFLALPADHPLTANTAVSITQLDGVAMGSLQSTHAHQQDVQAHFKAQDLAFSSMVESQTFLPILQFVSAGQCCAILDPLTVVHVEATAASGKTIAFRPLREAIRYRYAVFAPRYRPISILAQTLRDAWVAEVLTLLETIGANPKRDCAVESV
ncbi:LysR family transcriptional regulator [Roseobacter sp. WL0113]|uniref:LysR family transcriptional regulator n=2 Tax=Roseobacter sinensis TaxID=2931391 RepID=A0ABT3BEZ1_9RHOB|nr:LysR family transcriptional regulator [Roseobacter sp. WL0113]